MRAFVNTQRRGRSALSGVKDMKKLTNFKEMVRSAWDAAWNHGQVDALDEIVHPEYALESAGQGRTSGLAELKAQVRDIRAAIPDLQTTVDMIVVDGDDFAIFWSATGAFVNAFGDVPPTGRVLQAHGAVQGVLREGRIIRERVTWDPSVEMLSELGAPGLGSAFESGGASDDTGKSEKGPSFDELKE